MTRPSAILLTQTMHKFRDALMRLGGVKKPLRLDIDSRRHTFRSVIDFEFALESRTDFPVEHFSRLIKLGPVELERTARDLRRIERRALDLIERALDEPAGLSADLADMELELFSSDHQWDQIFRGLVTQDRQYDEFKRVALSAYLKYLRARQNIMQSLNEASVERESGEVSLNPGETAIFDSSMPASSQDPSNHLEALPRGQSVGIQLDASGQLDFMLSRYPFTLIGGKAFLLIDDTGQRHPLHPGKNYVGRQQGNDVVVDAAHRAVSRRHLIVEPVGESAAVPTDLSSHGTFVPPQCVI